jgi:ABC-type sugar transport system ATPase subunit
MHGMAWDRARGKRSFWSSGPDLSELVDLWDRVVVFQRGRITDEIGGEALSEQALSLATNAGSAAPS